MSFKEYLKECLEGGEDSLPAVHGEPDVIDFSNPADRESVNSVLSDRTDGVMGDPAVVYEQIRGILMDVGYAIPPASAYAELLSDTDGEEVIGLGVTTHEDGGAHYLYFAFSQDEDGDFEVLAEIVTEEELEEILE